MAEKDADGPSLELPSLGFGLRRRRKDGRQDHPAATEAPSEAPATPAETAEAPTVEPAPPPPPPVPEAAERPTERLSPVTPPEPAGKPLFADEAATTRVDQDPVPAADPTPPVEGEPEPTPGPRREFALPSIGTRTASLITGLLVGVLTVGATWGGLRLCEVVRGTSSCGDPGFLLLLAIVIAMVWIGSLLLRAWEVPDPGSTSFLGVGLLTVLVLLFLVDVLFNWWMILVIPVLAMLTFVLADWVASVFVEDD